MAFAGAITGKLKSIFLRKTDSSQNLPVLEARDDNFYESVEETKLSTISTISTKTSEFDIFNNKGETHSQPTISSVEQDELRNILQSNKGETHSQPTISSVEQEKLRNTLQSNIALSKETVSEGHVLLSKAFCVSDELLSLISPAVAREYKVLPVEIVNSTLSILYCDNILRGMCENQIIDCLVEKNLNYKLNFVLASYESLIETIDHVYSTINSSSLIAEQQQLAERHSQMIQGMETDSRLDPPTGMVFDIKVPKDQSPFEEILARLFCEVHMRRGTDCDIDLNFIPKSDGTEVTEFLVRTRIDNSIVVIERERMGVETYQKLITVAKVLAGLDTGKNRSQMTGYITGRLIYGTRSPKIEMRVNLIPTGKKRISSLSIRFQSQHENDFNIKNIGFFSSDEKRLKQDVFGATDGLVLICGRVNCGKNTTLIAFINELKKIHSDKKIVLLEDPIEQVLPDVLQIQVDNSDKELGFNHFLRAALRHNPDILGVGETRDSESANLVLEAASAGHLTFSTFHTSDSTKAVERMVSLTGDTSKLADSLRAIISQKLVKTICKKCVKEVDSNLFYIERLDEYIAKLGWRDEVQFMHATGKTSNGTQCRYCNGTGLYGRIGIFEILTFSEKMRDLILKNAPTYQLRKQAIKEGLKSVFLNGLKRALMGEITLTELIKQTGYPNPEKEGLSFDYDSDNNELN